jgi:uncharacterized protein (DUF1501 family)
MFVTRRQFIKQAAGSVTVGLLAPRLFAAESRAGELPAGAGRRIFVVIQLEGGNDGLNTVVPYTNAQYYKGRPTLAFKDSELVDPGGASTIISDQFGLHPSMSALKSLYDQGRVAIVNGVGYPDPSLSHFLSMDIWHTANLSGLGSEGWLGKYADTALAGIAGLPAAAVGGLLPKTFLSQTVVIPSIITFQLYDFLTDPVYPGDSANQLSTFGRDAGDGSANSTLAAAIDAIAMNAVQGAIKVKTQVAGYTSPVQYPANNPLAAGLEMLAQILTTITESTLVYVSLGSFDHHADQISHTDGKPDKLSGQHARLLGWFSDGVKAFYDDMAAHQLADNTLIMQWSEFGRRVGENTSFGTDHGTAAPLFIIGNPVQRGLFGGQPSIEPADLDGAGNMKFEVDFRSVYSTILDRWLGVDSTSVLGQRFEDVGFLA